MRPQTVGMIVGGSVTAMFMAVVGLVALWQYLPTPEPRGQLPQQHQFVVFNPNIVMPNVVEDPGNLDFPRPENVIPPAELRRARGEAIPVAKYTLSGPHTHGNLSLFLIHGEDTLKDDKILTLQEALDQGLAVVHDRGQLFIDNRSNVPLFIQAGDIVKGGSQDRTLPFDMLISAWTNQTPVAAFCVEAGRSGPRGNERSASFQSSTEQLPGRRFRLATLAGAGQAQTQVWANVQTLQTNLARSVGGSVQAPISQTSLQLTLEHPRVQGAVQKYVADLGRITDGKNDAIGHVVVINGKIQSADVYASNSLFQKVWPKLLKASVVEALSEQQGSGANVQATDVEAVRAFLDAAEQGTASRVQLNRGVVLRHDTPNHLLFDTCDPARGNLVLHRSFLAK